MKANISPKPNNYPPDWSNKLLYILFNHIICWIGRKLDIRYIDGCYLGSSSDMKELFKKFNNDEDY